MNKLNVLFASAEVTPIAKVGGLADVAGALPKALIKHDVDIRIIMPKYDIIDTKGEDIELVLDKLPVETGAGTELIDLYSTKLPGSDVTVYLVDSNKYYRHGSVYFEKSTFVKGISDVEKFVFFSMSVVKLLPLLEWNADILHCQDWHTGLVPVLKELAEDKDKEIDKIKTLYTIHNLGSQGAWSAKDILEFLQLEENDHPNFSVRDERGNFRLLEQGIIGSDFVNTVSPTYAEEILTPEFGLGLEEKLTKVKRENRLIGILNGIDIEHFNPETDQALKENYSLNKLAGKHANKAALQKWAGLEVNPDIPVIGFVGRLFDQKGFDLLPPIADHVFKNNVQFILLGTGLERQEEEAGSLAKKYPDKIKAEIAFDPDLAQLIYAGADLFLMPSRYEPCGLGQMIAMRYGTLPIVNATGGLKDTVIDAENKGGTGFVFSGAEPENLLSAINHALAVYKDKKRWEEMINNCMSQDFSWDHSSLEYLKLYQSLVK